MSEQRTVARARERARLNFMQALEDAIAFRRARATEPCPDCGLDGMPCDDHACDLILVATYRRKLAAVAHGTDPAVVVAGR